MSGGPASWAAAGATGSAVASKATPVTSFSATSQR